jgi:hypothetical protein
MTATEEGTLKAGLLMEAAQTHQQQAQLALDRLSAHTAGLDEVVREEIRETLLTQLHALAADVHGACEALRSLKRVAAVRLTLWSLGIMLLATLAPFALVYNVLPSAGEIATLSARREELNARIAQLAQAGADLELRRCGVAQRLCVRIERGTPSYGQDRDFLIVRGH